MIRASERIFVDTGPWVALALTRDEMHGRAVGAWEQLLEKGARLITSVPVFVETFTQIDRRANRDAALAWRDSVRSLRWWELVTGSAEDVAVADHWMERKDLHKLSLVDATSFVIMTRLKLRVAFTFDSHFAAAGFRCIG